MLKSIKDDNRHIKLTKFDSKCPKNYYKGVVVVDTKIQLPFFKTR